MRRGKATAILYHGSGYLIAALTIASAFIGLLKGANVDELKRYPGALAASLLWIRANGGWLVVALPLMVTPLAVMRKVIGPPWLWDHVHFLLDHFQKTIYTDRVSDEKHHNRVTFFRFVRWHFCWRRWPWSGWLVPISRSGHTSQKTRVKFRAPDAADRAEGIAGMTWARLKIVDVSGLPDVTGDATDGSIRNYAQRTGVDPSWVLKNKPSGRSFLGIHIEVKGNPWGVIVLDSRDPKAIQTDEAYHVLFSIVGKSLGKLLEGVKRWPNG